MFQLGILLTSELEDEDQLDVVNKMINIKHGYDFPEVNIIESAIFKMTGVLDHNLRIKDGTKQLSRRAPELRDNRKSGVRSNSDEKS